MNSPKHKLEFYQHPHNFHEVKSSNYNKVIIVLIITCITMFAEIFLGWLFRSMALLSDGWHMATHASALLITLGTYYFAKKYSTDSSYSFGTWKIEILGAYTSAIFLFLVAAMVVYSSVERMFHPVSILYDQAMLVTLTGLIVNVLCALVLGHQDHTHDHAHDHHDNAVPHHDLNMRSAYLHVLADALTSIFALLALFFAKLFDLAILDPFIGILSSILIFKWSLGLLKDTAVILLDRNINTAVVQEIKDLIEADHDSKISDLHLWLVGENKYSCTLTIVANKPKTLEQYQAALKPVHELAHLVIEINTCPKQA